MAVTPDPEEVEYEPFQVGPNNAPAEMEAPVDTSTFEDLCAEVGLDE